MKLKYKVLGGLGAMLIVGMSALALALSHETPCPASAGPLRPGTASMRAITHRCYGSSTVLALEQVARPAVGPRDVLIKVHAVSLNPFDMHMVSGKPYVMRLSTGLGAPVHQRAGHDFAGSIEAVGANVTRFKVGDDVFGAIGGALADYIVAGEDAGFAIKPGNVSFEDVAALDIAGGTAL